MHQSAEGKLKSKYESSSRKIKELYSEFQSLKSRINTPSRSKRQENSFDYSIQESIFKTESLQVPRLPIQRRLAYQTQKPSSDFQMRSFIRNSVQKFMVTSLTQLDRRVDEKCNLMDDRVQNLRKLLDQVGRLMKIKATNEKVVRRNQNCNCKWKGQEVQEVEEKYQIKMNELISCYEHKISLLLKENNTSSSSMEKKIPKEIEEDLKNMEEKLLIKEKQITELKLESSRLRRQSDNNCKLLRDKEKLLEELSQEIKDKESHIKQLDQTIESRVAKYEKQIKTIKCENKAIIKKLNAEMEKTLKINESLQAEVNRLDVILVKQEEASEQATIIKEAKDIDWNQSYIQKQDFAASEGDDEMSIQNQLAIHKEVRDFDRLRHSHIVQGNNKAMPFRLENTIKQLQCELQLIAEQNKLLKGKKDKFEEQVKENESDQQKFQMQSQILKDQLKRMNKNLRLLDDCAVLYLREKKVGWEKFSQLDDSLQFKKQLSNKFPQRKSSSVVKSIK